MPRGDSLFPDKVGELLRRALPRVIGAWLSAVVKPEGRKSQFNFTLQLELRENCVVNRRDTQLVIFTRRLFDKIDPLVLHVHAVATPVCVVPYKHVDIFLFPFLERRKVRGRRFTREH